MGVSESDGSEALGQGRLVPAEGVRRGLLK